MWQDIMEVRALCIRLLITVLILLCAHAQKVDAVSLRVVPNKSQFFEHESVSFYCEESSHGYVLYKKNEEVKQCNKTSRKPTASTTGSQCTIDCIYRYDNGEYWCGTAGGKRSNNIYITVTDGSVILEIPAVPVMEGEDVSLRCRNKMLSSSIAADFYKYGRHIGSSVTGNMTIHRVSKSDEGLYKCKISGGEESSESWLSVSLPCLTASTPWIIATILLTTLIVIIVVMGLYLFRKDLYRAYGSGPKEDPTGQNTNNEAELCPNPVYHSLGQGGTQPLAETMKSAVAYKPSQDIYQPVAEEPFYSTIKKHADH
ncbi:low affinity immunoglobulin gamma Fc region receptor II-like [Oreochromis aureus]|uniref:low affinity immunoglobulin gamma Fc region receptor II-like n=1 Tax=Oreochromis aureus TaxID=47969 RepID=UPI0019540465|nr:low affinity immunoglobulin gamma Fc region receptor II-like [Oreochromis aureus]